MAQNYARYPERFDHHMTADAKRMLKEIAEARKRPMAEVARDIFESSIRRRYARMVKKRESSE